MDHPPEESRAKPPLKSKPFDRVNAPLAQEVTKPIQVEQILRDNLRLNEAAKPFTVEVETRMSRRKRDYLILLAGGIAAGLLVLHFLPKDPVLRLLGMSGLGLYTLGLTWIMWGVMDNY